MKWVVLVEPLRTASSTATPRDVPDAVDATHTHLRRRREPHDDHDRRFALVWWTWEVEDAFRAVKEGDKHAMKTLEARLTKQLNELVAMVRQDLNKINRKKSEHY